MSGMSAIFSAGLSGLNVAQQGLGVTSQNIANANTPGYVRTEVTLAPRALSGPGGGVEVAAISRAADQFLATAGYIAEAAKGASAARRDILARAQASFGDPAGASSMFASVDAYWAALTQLGVDPSSTLRRDDAVAALNTAYDEIGRVSAELQQLASETDQRIGEAVQEVQSLSNRIASLNKEVQLTRHSGADASAAENAQAALVDQLSALLDIRVSALAEGGVTVRTSGGGLLVGAEAATISYTPNSAEFAAHNVIQFNPQLGSGLNLEPYISGGKLGGLIEARDTDIPALAEALGGVAAGLGDVLNEVHNENTASPAVRTLAGRDTGLLASDNLNFTGDAVIGVVNSSGVLVDRLTIDFDARTITSTAGTIAFSNTIGDAASAGTFVAQLDAALAGASAGAGADFVNGALSLDGGGGGRLVVQQDSADPSARAGRGFSHFFGLNDLVSRPTPLFFESGVTGSDLHGFNSGGEIVFRVRDFAGRFIVDRTVSISGALTGATSDWDDLVTALNTSATGIGEYGQFTLDATSGRLSFANGASYDVEIIADSTTRGTTGISLTSLNGLTASATAGRAQEAGVNAAIRADPGRLGVARPDLSVAIGERVVEAADGRGAAALAAARDTARDFEAAGALGAQTTSLGLYVSRLGGEAGRLASDAERAAKGSEAVATAAADRRAQIEGVNIDDELLKMTTYQNAYAAAARVIQAATDMLDVLLSIGAR